MALANNIVPFPAEEMEPARDIDPATLQDVQEGGFDIDRKRRMFQDAEEAHEKERELAFRDEDYYHNFDDGQWSAAEKRKLSERGQPRYTHNRIKRKVNFLMGMEQRGRTDPKALPRKPKSEMMAEVATDILAAIDDQTQFDQTASESFFHLLVHGVMACEDRWDPQDREIISNDIPYEEYFRDPRSKKHDLSDARYQGYAKWFDLSDAQALYGSEQQLANLQASLDRGTISYAGYDDCPDAIYGSTVRNVKRVRIITMYYRGPRNDWRLTHFCGGGDLYDVPSPWLDGKGRPDCGITAERLYVDRENRAYGVVRDMIGPQQEDNHFRAKLWHMANDRSFWYNDGAFGDHDNQRSAIERAKAEMAKVDGAVRINPAHPRGESWDFIDRSGQANILAGLLRSSDDELNRQGPNAGLQGRGASSQSGRSRLVQQQSGMIEENNVFDRLSNWKRRSFIRKFNLARQFWRDEDFIRVTDEEDGPRFIEINKQLWQGGRFLGVKNDMSKMDVDIILEEMPDVANIQSEQFEAIANLLGLGIPPHLMAALIKTSTLRDKDKLVAAIMAPMTPDPNAAQIQALAMTDREAKVRKTMAETEKLEAQVMSEKASAALDMTKASLGQV